MLDQCDVVRQSIRVFSWVSLVCVEGLVYELKGLPIGEVLSGLCLSVLLGTQEYVWNSNRLEQIKAGFDFGSFRGSQCIALLRYEDDILMISVRYCRRCLVEFGKKSYLIPVSVASDVNSDVSPSRVAAQWVDVDFYANDWKVCMAPNIPNRKLLSQCVSTGGVELIAREKWSRAELSRAEQSRTATTTTTQTTTTTTTITTTSSSMPVHSLTPFFHVASVQTFRAHSRLVRIFRFFILPCASAAAAQCHPCLASLEKSIGVERGISRP